MAASFLNYCAMCEKQIMTPCNSILYCSEACRRRDSNKPLSASILEAPESIRSAPPSPKPTPLASKPSSNSYTNLTALRIPPDLHDHKPDLDPTEWKPKLPYRYRSEAYRYLSRFHLPAAADVSNEYTRVDRERFMSRHKTSNSVTTIGTSNATATPSLANSPITAASSFDSVYNFSTRPLSARHNPVYALSSSVKSDELVKPHIPPYVPNVDVDKDDTEIGKWEKKTIIKGGAQDHGGLGVLMSKTEEHGNAC